MRSFRLPAMDSAAREDSRKYRAKIRARDRRQRQMDLLQELSSSLPLDQTELDYSSLLRLTVAFLKTKKIVQDTRQGIHGDNGETDQSSPEAVVGCSGRGDLGMSEHHELRGGEAERQQLVCAVPSRSKETSLQHLMVQALDGFLLVFGDDGSILFASKTVNKYLGLTQTECMSQTLFDLVVEDDLKAVENELEGYKDQARDTCKDVQCSFFCRMKCLSSKGQLGFYKTDSHKLMYINGMYKCGQEEDLIVAMVTPVTPPPIMGIRMEGNMFRTHYRMDMRCVFYDGRLTNLLGYGPDLKGQLIFDLHHHDDLMMCKKACEGLLTRGETVSGYYRLLTKWMGFVWCQTRAVLKCDSTTGEPNRIECMNFIISVDEGEKSLRHRSLALTDTSSTLDSDILSPLSSSMSSSLSPASMGMTSELHMTCAHDPIPITHETRQNQNPFSDDTSSAADTCLQSSSSSFASGSPSASCHVEGQPNYRTISPHSPEDVNDVFSVVSDATSYSPGLLSARANHSQQCAANSPGHLSSTNSPNPGLMSSAASVGLSPNSPGLLSSAASVGLSPTNSPGRTSSAASVRLSPTNSSGLQSVANSPALFSAANSPGQLTANSSPAVPSPASSFGSPCTNGPGQYPPNCYHDNNGMYYGDFPNETAGGVFAAEQSSYRPLNSGPGLLSYSNGPGLQVPFGAMPPPHSLSPHQATGSAPISSMHCSTSNFIAMATAPSSVHMRVPSSTPSTFNGTSDVNYDVDVNRFLSELDRIPFKV